MRLYFTSARSSFHKKTSVQDVLAMPGRLIFQQQQLVEVQLNQRHPYATEVAIGLVRLLDHFGYP